MCGITGIVYNNSLADSDDINNMSNAIAHRGPDGEGFIAINTISGKITELGGLKAPVNLPPLPYFGSDANIYLAHRRLSIIDLTKAGHQPMSNKWKKNWITFNGEIYNYKSLRNELPEFEFKSNTDTEVLLNAYEKWGINCLQRLNGMWAFVIYDARKKILFGSRDRFGVKPLYYTNNKDFFAFNSEIKGLLAKQDISHRINSNASAAYLRWGVEAFEDETFFSDISELKPAHYFIYDIENKDLIIKKYFELSYCDTWESFDERKCNDYVDETKQRVTKAIDLRLNADVTVGSCLSGGMDSSAIVCTVNKLLEEKLYRSVGTKQAVVTACYKDSIIDESNWAQIVVDDVQADWHKVFPKQAELFADMSDLIFTQEVPFCSTSMYAQYRVMKTAKEAGITVMLDGQGGDELFTGYTSYYNMFYAEALKNKDFGLLSSEQDHILNTTLNDENIKKTASRIFLKNMVKKYMPEQIKYILRHILCTPESKYVSFTGKIYRQYSDLTLNQMLYSLMIYGSLPRLLKYEDKNSMRFSIESRTPFADDIDLIEYVFKIPSIYKIHNGWSKYLLRESMNGIIPDKIKKRTDKIGFATPEYMWLQSIKPYIFDHINPDINAVLKINKLEKNWDNLFSKQKRNGTNGTIDLWRYVNFILWFNVFKVTV